MTRQKSMQETAFAKINLSLHILGKRVDGYHDLDTIFAFVDGGDVLTAKASNDLSLSIHGQFGEGLASDESNLIIRAVSALRDYANIKNGAAITLDKRLPVASGIGGGSADAAAAARLLNRLWALHLSDKDLAQILAPLGADIPACVYSKTLRGGETGQQLRDIDDSGISGTAVLLVNPGVMVSTAAVFGAWDQISSGPLYGDNAAEMMMKGHNDMERPARLLCPEIAEVLDVLAVCNPIISRMSGSGATCFAIFSKQEQCKAAKAEINKAKPEWWTMAGHIK
jgi:4-diphosphocytidyl-2-C-methyl-D-erythritol kinase